MEPIENSMTQEPVNQEIPVKQKTNLKGYLVAGVLLLILLPIVFFAIGAFKSITSYWAAPNLTERNKEEIIKYFKDNYNSEVEITSQTLKWDESGENGYYVQLKSKDIAKFTDKEVQVFARIKGEKIINIKESYICDSFANKFWDEHEDKLKNLCKYRN